MNPSVNLHRLQVLDTKLDLLQKQILNQEGIIRNTTEIDISSKMVEEKLAHFHEIELKLTKISAKRRELSIKVEQSESSLYSGTIHNPKELQDLQNEIRSLRKIIPGIEEEEFSLMMELERAQTELQIAQKNLNQLKQIKILSNQERTNKVESLVKDKEILLRERNAALPSITPDLLTIYERIRQQKNGLAVIDIVDDSCSGCGSEITKSEWQQARTSLALIYCQGCGRIIFGN